MKFVIKSISTISLISFFLLLFLELPIQSIFSIGLGWFLALIYVITGFILFNKALNLRNKSFGIMITISVFSRLVIVALGIALIVKFLNIDNSIFIITLFSFYFIFQIIEIIQLNKVSIKGVNF